MMDDSAYVAGALPQNDDATIQVSGDVRHSGLSLTAQLAGQQLGNYRLLRLLAHGGFADIYLGEHIHLETQAAIKVLRAQLRSEDLTTFRAEARLVARLRHPHIISVFDFDVQNGMPFLVMDYAPNGSLRQRHSRGTALDPTLVLSYLSQIVDALQYAHNQRLVHRDIKPENMLLGQRGEVLLSDFGIAVSHQTSPLDIRHKVIGTVTYMAPEQFSGRVLSASDQYSLGVVVYEWLCGYYPFDGSLNEVAVQHCQTPPPSLRARNLRVTPELEIVVNKALAKDPAQRYASVSDFAQAFARACPLDNTVLPSLDPACSPVETVDHAAETIALALPASMMQAGVVPSSPRSPVDQPGSVGRRAMLLALGGAMVVSLTGGGVAWYMVHSSGAGMPGSAPTALPQNSPTAVPTPQSGTPLYTYRDHTDIVLGVAWSPVNTTYIASASRDGSARVWQATSGLVQKSYTGQGSSIHAITWSPDGQHVASAGEDNVVQIWQPFVKSADVITYSGHSATVNTVSWSPVIGKRARYIASGSNESVVRLWNAADASDVATYTQHSDAILSVAWSPNGAYIASASADKTVQVWNPSSPDTAITNFQQHNDAVLSVVWSPDGQYLASGGADQIVYVWNALTGGNPLVTYSSHTGAVNALSWSPDGQFIASASDDGSVQIWKAYDGNHKYTYNGHIADGQASTVYAVSWSSDGKYLASGAADKTVQIWHA